MKILTSKPYLYAELLILMLAIPAAIYKFDLIRYMLPMLWVIAFYCWQVHRRTTDRRWRDDWDSSKLRWEFIRPIVIRFALCAAFLAIATWMLMPERFLSLLLQKPAFWLLIMIAYPILSVLPQEIIFRQFFFERYKAIFKTRELTIIASGLAFGMAHIIFQNWVAPLLTAVGGILFALTYAKHRALSLVSLEHALFGDFIFTIGLGYYFYHGTVGALAVATGQ